MQLPIHTDLISDITEQEAQGGNIGDWIPIIFK